MPHGACDTRAECDYARDEAATLSGEMSAETFKDRMYWRGLGALIGSSFFGNVPFVAAGERVFIGLTEQAAAHSFRHVISRGLSVNAVRNRVLGDARSVLYRLRPGQTLTRTVNVGGKKVEYRLHRLADGRVSIGSIRPPRP